MRILQSAHRAEVGAEVLHLDQVIAIEWKRGVRDSSTNRAKGEAFDVTVLRRILPDTKRLAGRTNGRIPDGKRTDLSRCGEIPLQQDRRHAENIGVVVKAISRIVGW